MTDLQTQAREYAEHIIDSWRKDKAIGLKRMLSDAYIQGWDDRDTRDMKPETQDEFLKENRG